MNLKTKTEGNFESSLTKRCLLKSKRSLTNPKNQRKIVKGRPERQRSAISGKKSIMSIHN